MTYPSSHLRVTWFGDAWMQQEEWSTGLRLDGTTLPTTAQMDALDTAFQTLFSSSAAKTSYGARYWGVKVAPQNSEGLYGETGQAVEKIRPAVHFTANSGGLPQATLAVTLTTGTLRGLANEGRMYLPATSHLPSDDGRITLAQADALRSVVVDFIVAVNAVGLGPVTVFSKVGTGAKRAVNGVRVGRVIDTQRRRRNQISEEYRYAAVPPP